LGKILSINPARLIDLADKFSPRFGPPNVPSRCRFPDGVKEPAAAATVGT
jgi:hypothetical protein